MTTLPQLTETTTIVGTDEVLVNDGGNARRASVANLFKGRTTLASLGTVGAPTYSFDGDTNTGMWSPAADTLAWSAGGAQRMCIDSAGDVGIATTNPLVRLQVQSTLGFSGAGNFPTIHNNVYFSDGSWRAMITGYAGYQFFDVGNGRFSFDSTAISVTAGEPATLNNRMRIEPTGDVGIATASPSTRLHVNGPIRKGSYTVATLPAAATVGAGTQVYCTDGDAGSPCIAESNGTNWLRVALGAAVAAS